MAASTRRSRHRLAIKKAWGRLLHYIGGPSESRFIVSKAERAARQQEWGSLNMQNTPSALPNNPQVQATVDLSLSQQNHPNAASSSRPNPAADLTVRHLTLPNGDIYSGTTSCGLPDGTGRYVWSGTVCIYDGEWRRGMRNGHGRTTWPSSGAVYDGEYSAGYMDGEGTHVETSSSSYKGQWKLDRKHGVGFQTYPNGDTYLGSWAQGQMEGHGRYTWAADRSTYVGAMRNGTMSGKGVLAWTTGDSFQGNWLGDTMHGYGLYTWEDGGYYLGIWTRGVKDGKGTFFPKSRGVLVEHELYIDDLRKRGVLPDITNVMQCSSSFENDTNVGVNRGGARLSRRNNLSFDQQSPSEKPSLQRRWSIGMAKPSAGDSETQGCENSADSSLEVLEREYAQGVLISEIVLNNGNSETSKNARRRRQSKAAKDVKRPGETIIKGHMSYDLMLSLQLGIRYTVGKITPIQAREMRTSDYGPRACFWMNFPITGSRLTPAHCAVDFKWKDYCPMVFRNLREMFKIDTTDYMISICGSDALRELSSPGKSGSIFFLSQDDRFMIKLFGNLKQRVKPSSGRKFRFVVMGNMFYTELRVHRRFDLKGSSLGRSNEKIEIDVNTTFKDLDLNYSFYLEPSWRDALLKQIGTDSEFLRNQGIMDYSLLLGLHYRARQSLKRGASCHESLVLDKLTNLTEGDSMEEKAACNYREGLVLVQRGSDQKGEIVVSPHIRGSPLGLSSACFEEVDLLIPGTARLPIQLGVNMPARAEKQEEDGSKSLWQVYDVVLYIGIIDILQKYNMKKKIEHAYKSIKYKYNPLSISSVKPQFYSERFLKFIHTVFPQNSS
uniref:1-phosphatidylinositol-4-phosphate 5-kinase n=1 Tax=Aegilops tauschii TaxID=37682 RepID=M8CIE8_AEGTA